MKLLSCVAAVGLVVLAATTLHPRAVTRTTLAVPGRANANVSMAVSGSFVAAVCRRPRRLATPTCSPRRAVTAVSPSLRRSG
ncbi:MAG: hypothetical protein U0Q11_03480 [Vicinamibacterales bacterium]